MYCRHGDRFYFASEIKAIFCDPSVPRKLDFRGLDEVFTWWTTAPPRTVFEGVNELEAGHYLTVVNGKLSTHRYWSMQFPTEYDRDRSVDSWA